jgi:hypothetical protein
VDPIKRGKSRSADPAAMQLGARKEKELQKYASIILHLHI